MRHKIAGFKLKRDPSARKALLRGLVTSVIEQERVITTVPKAKAVKPLVDRMITLAKRDTLHARRQAGRPDPTSTSRTARSGGRSGAANSLFQTPPRNTNAGALGAPAWSFLDCQAEGGVASKSSS